MKKSLFMLAGAAAIVLSAVSLRAQQNPMAPQAMRANSGDPMELSAEQQAKYDEIRAASRKKIEEVYKEMKVYQDKIEAIKEEEKAEFEKILTPDQKQVYEAMQAEREAVMKARKAQAEEMRKARKARAEEMKKAREAASAPRQ